MGSAGMGVTDGLGEEIRLLSPPVIASLTQIVADVRRDDAEIDGAIHLVQTGSELAG
jgi:1,6-anhydro-N-acetylmuramate kinase